MRGEQTGYWLNAAWNQYGGVGLDGKLHKLRRSEWKVAHDSDCITKGELNDSGCITEGRVVLDEQLISMI